MQVTIRSNPSLAKIAFARRQNPLAKAAFPSNTEAGDEQKPDQAAMSSPEEAVVVAPEGSQANAGDGRVVEKDIHDGSSDDSQESTENAR